MGFLIGWGTSHELYEENEGAKALYVGISVGLTVLAGLMSGLTLGLMSMDHVDMEASLLLTQLLDR